MAEKGQVTHLQQRDVAEKDQVTYLQQRDVAEKGHVTQLQQRGVAEEGHVTHFLVGLDFELLLLPTLHGNYLSQLILA